ncbi:MAG: hypothetical protein KDA22_07545 [Phycisphaerales bacterium]|nr:hypothetical protein [Phycisphaerales bacterium]
MSESTPRPRRWLRRLVILIVLLVVAVGVLIALAPTLLGTAAGRSAIASTVNGGIKGTVSIGELNLAWTSGQSIKHLVVKDPVGRTVADLDLAVDKSLLELLKGGYLAASLGVSGSLDTDVRANGSTSLGDAFASRGTGGSSKPSAPATGPPLPAGLDATVDLKGLNVRVHDDASDRTLEIKALNGTAIVSGTRPVSLQLRGGTTFAGQSGTFALDASATNLVRSDGSLTFKGAGASADLSIESVSLPLSGMTVSVKNMVASLAAPDLLGTATLTADGAATIDGNVASSLQANISAGGLFDEKGAFALALDRIEGSLDAKNVPTALAQPFLKDTPLVASRDLGPTIDALATFGAGTERRIDLSATTQQMKLVAGATVDPASGAVASDRVELDLAITPELLADAAKLRIDAAMPVSVHLTNLRIPGTNKNGQRDLAATALAGRVTIPNTVQLHSETGDPLAELEAIDLRIDAPRLGDGASLALDGKVDGAVLKATAALSELVGTNGLNAADAMRGDIAVSLTGMSGDRVANFAPEAQRELVAEVLRGPLEMVLAKQGPLLGGKATADLTGAALTARAETAIGDDAITLAVPSATLHATPKLVELAQAGAESPIRLAAPGVVKLSAPAVSIPRAKLSPFDLAGIPLTAAVSAGSLELAGVPGTAAAVQVDGLVVDATATIGGETKAKGKAAIATPGSPVAQVGFDVAMGSGDAAALAATIDATGLQIAGLERLLGREPKSLTDLVGATGTVRATASRGNDGVLRIKAVPALEQLGGEIDVNASPGLYEIATRNLKTTVQPALIERYLEPSSAGTGGTAGSAPAPPGIKVTAPVGLSLDIDRLTVDPALFGDGPIDPGKVVGDMKVVAAPIQMQAPSGERLGFERLTFQAKVTRLNEPVNLTIDGAGSSGSPSSVKGTASIAHLLDAASRLATDAATVDLDLTAQGIPTAVLDRMQNFDGKLVAALGDTVAVNAKAAGLSRDGGILAGAMTSPNGRLDIPEMVMKNKAITIAPAKPITGQLAVTKPLREKLLHSINPILADIRTTEQPLKLTISSANVPLDGDRKRLNANGQLTFGKVEFDPGSTMLGFLELFNKKDVNSIPGFISPLNVKITNGELTYDDFAVKVGKYGENDYKHQLVFFGDIDLASKPEMAKSIKARYPGDGLAKSIKEVPAAVGFVYVEIDFYGPLYDSAGNSVPLKYKINLGAELPKKPEEILNDPKVKDLIDEGLKSIFDKGKKK